MPATLVSDAAVKAARACLKRMPVIDRHGRLVGIVRRTDLLRALVRDDAAIRREIETRVLKEDFGFGREQVRAEVVNGRGDPHRLAESRPKSWAHGQGSGDGRRGRHHRSPHARARAVSGGLGLGPTTARRAG
ncbi:CBS domain-containing protein [Streptomyces humicola]|uniref:CBS domain-containing protein n=1 Tax=Streptomyces humicola TaxID=2953240 RepID=UPI003558B411